MTLTLLVSGPDLVQLGYVDEWTALDVTINRNAPSSGQFTAPADPQLMQWVTTPGNRVELIRDGDWFCAGPIEKPGAYQWSAGDATTQGVGQVTVNWADDAVSLASRLTYPDPARAATAQTTVAQYTASATNGETLMRSLVNLNAGPGALTARRVPNLVLGSVAGVGTNVSDATRFEVLTDVLRRVALAAGNLGFRVRRADSPARLLFEVYAPTDRSKLVRFSRQLNNLRALATDPSAPTCTVAIVGGSGDGVAQQVIERANSGAVSGWGRMEKFVSGTSTTDSTDPTTELNQAGDQALVDNGETVGLTATPVDTKGARYGVDYWLGDTVSVQLVTGTAVTDVVTAVHLTATPDAGELLVPTIGTSTAHTDTPTVRALRDLERRTSALERS